MATIFHRLRSSSKMGTPSLPHRFLRRAMRDQSGQTLVEFAITLSVLLTAVFTIVELGVAFYSWSTIEECACEGARYAIVRGSTCVASGGGACTVTATAVNSYVSALHYPNIGGGAMVVNTTYSADGVTYTTTGNNAPNDTVRVQITYNLPILLPFVPRNALSLSARSELTILQ